MPGIILNPIYALEGHFGHLKDNKRVKLDELFDRGDRYYFIVTFLSILVLANDKEVEIIQEGLFDDIYVEGKE